MVMRGWGLIRFRNVYDRNVGLLDVKIVDKRFNFNIIVCTRVFVYIKLYL